MNRKTRKEIEYRIWNFSRLEDSDPWKNVIKSVFEKYQGTEKGKLIELRYFRRKNEVQTCMELHISQRLYYDWVKDIIQDIAMMAAYEKLMKP